MSEDKTITQVSAMGAIRRGLLCGAIPPTGFDDGSNNQNLDGELQGPARRVGTHMKLTGAFRSFIRSRTEKRNLSVRAPAPMATGKRLPLFAVVGILLHAFLLAPAQAQEIDPSRWMGELKEDAANAGLSSSALDQTLAQFIFPGSHVAGSYGIPDFDILNPFDAPPLACDGCILPGNETILETPGLDLFVGYLLVPLAKTQNQTILQQLNAGARAFDLRFFKATAADAARSPELTAGQFYIHRTFAGASHVDIFNDIDTFFDTGGHEDEIVLLNFSQMYEGSGEMDTASLESFFQQLFSTVDASPFAPTRFAPETFGDSATLAQLAAQGKQIIVSYAGGVPLTEPTINNLVWPPIELRYFGSTDVNSPDGGYPKADTWNTERRLFNWLKTLGAKRTNQDAMFQMYVNMGPDDGSDFPDMLSRATLCNVVPIYDAISSVVDPIQLIFEWLDKPPSDPDVEPQYWEDFKTAAKEAIQNAIFEAAAKAALESLLDDGFGICPAINDDWDRFTSLEEVAAFTNPKLLPSLVGLPRGAVNIVLADYYTSAFTAEAKRLNEGTARLTVTIKNVSELECHDCFPPNGPGSPDYFPEISFWPNGVEPPDSWHAWPLYPNPHDNLDPGHRSHWGGPWLETTGKNINPNWLAMRSVSPVTPSADVHIRIWDQDNNLCPSPLWCGADDDSLIYGDSTVAGIRQPIWDLTGGLPSPLVDNYTTSRAGETGFFVFDSSRIYFNVDVCQWSLIPGQPATDELCGLAGFLGNTAPAAGIQFTPFPVSVVEGTKVLVYGEGYDPDPPVNADGDPIGKLVSWEWDCAYTGVPEEFEPNRECANAEPFDAWDPDQEAYLPRGLTFYVTDGPAIRELGVRVTDAGGLTSDVFSRSYEVTNYTPLNGTFVHYPSGGARHTWQTSFFDQGLDDGPFTCEWKIGSTVLTGEIVVEDRGTLYGNSFTLGQYQCTGTFDLPFGNQTIDYRVIDKDGAAGPTVSTTIDVTSGISLAAALGSPALSNVHSPIDLVHVIGWNGVILNPGTPEQDIAAQSGATDELKASWMRATVSGPGRLTFWWKISGDQYDELQVKVDGETFNHRFHQIFGEEDWQQVGVDILEGEHTVDWIFRDGYLGDGGGQGWVRDVVLSPVNITVSAPIVPGTVGTPYPDSTVTQSGGMDPATFAVTSGALPAGMTLSSAGILNGTPTAAGEFPITITATDADGFTGTGDFTLNIGAPTIILSAPSFPDGTTGTPYPDTTITQMGGAEPATFAVTGGALPPGLTLSSTGTVSGTPTWAGLFSFSVTATDANGFPGVWADEITIDAATAVVTNASDGDPGSLRDIIAGAVAGTEITFAPGLAGQTITLTTGDFLIEKNLEIDASDLIPGLTVSGNDSSRVFRISGGVTLVLNGLTIADGRADGDLGGCLSNANGGTLSLFDSTVKGCSALVGGAISNMGTLHLENSTVSGNQQGSYGAILNLSAAIATVVHSTVSDNHSPNEPSVASGGITNLGTVNIENSIVAGNTAGYAVDIHNVSPGTIVATGQNLIGVTTGDGTTFPPGPLVGSLVAPLDPSLAPLGDYGGPTPTMPPYSDSLAMDAAITTGNGPATDQRGFLRPGSLADIGAVEVIGIPMDVIFADDFESGNVTAW